MIIKENFPERLRKLGASLELSQTELGNRIGVRNSKLELVKQALNND